MVGFSFSFSFFKFIIDVSGCLRLLLLINLSSSLFDNYNNDYIIKWPMGNIRFENCRFSFLLVRIYTHILIVVSSGLCLKVRTKVKRKIDWSLDEGCFFLYISDLFFLILAINVYLDMHCFFRLYFFLLYTMLNHP